VIETTEQLSCQELVELLTDFLEGALSPRDRRRFEEHLSHCVGCQAHLDQVQTTIRLLGRVTPASLSPDAERALLETFRDWRR